MKLMITGATGFLGARAAEFFRGRAEIVVLPSALTRGEITARRADELKAAVCEAAPDVLLHTAAISDTGYAEAHPEESYEANVALPAALARASAQCGCKLVSCSSDQVYNGCDPLSSPFDEAVALAPMSVYGRHKLEAEALLAASAPDAVSLRLTWMYDLPAYGLSTHRNLLLNLLTAAAQHKPLPLSTADLRGVTYGRQVIENLPAAFTLPGGVYNFGSGGPHSVYDIALGWCGLLGLSPSLLRAESGRSRSLCMDCAKAERYGIHFDDSIDGLTRCIHDYGQGLRPCTPQGAIAP